jgi:hypothetical protein
MMHENGPRAENETRHCSDAPCITTGPVRISKTSKKRKKQRNKEKQQNEGRKIKRSIRREIIWGKQKYEDG